MRKVATMICVLMMATVLGCGGGEAEKASQFVSADFGAAVIVHPSKALSSTMVKPFTDNPEYKKAVGVGKAMGFDFTKLETATILLPADEQEAKGDNFGVVLRMSEAFDIKKVLENAKKSTIKVDGKDVKLEELDLVKFGKHSTVKVADVECLKFEDEKAPLACQIDDKTLLLGKEAAMKSMLAAKGGGSGPLCELIKAAPNQGDVLIAAVTAPYKKTIEEQKKGLAMSPLASFGGFVNDIDNVIIMLDLSGSEMVNAKIALKDDAKAKSIVENVQKSVKLLGDSVKDAPAGDPNVKMIKQLADGIKVNADGKVVAISIPRLDGIEETVKTIPMMMMPKPTGMPPAGMPPAGMPSGMPAGMPPMQPGI